MADEKLMQVIEKAIQRETDAYAFYMGLVDKVKDPDAVDTLKFMAKEETKHRRWLEAYRDGGYGSEKIRMADVVYYKVAEYEKEPEVREDMGVADIFLVAAHREKRSNEFYTELAAIHPEGETRDILLKMANEELKHKEKMEYLYANSAFVQTSGG